MYVCCKEKLGTHLRSAFCRHPNIRCVKLFLLLSSRDYRETLESYANLIRSTVISQRRLEMFSQVNTQDLVVTLKVLVLPS